MKFESTAGSFQLQAPENWTYIRAQGVDAFIGKIAIGDSDTLGFNLGYFSMSLENPIFRPGDDEEPNSDVSWEQIGDYKVKFVSHKSGSMSDYGAYIDSVWTDVHDVALNSRDNVKFTIYGVNLSKSGRKKLKDAMRTIKFYR